MYLRYRRSDFSARLDASVNRADLIDLAQIIEPTSPPSLKLALEEYKNGVGQECAWFTESFWNDWQRCTRGFAEYARLV